MLGFLNYFRRVLSGHKFTKHGKILYIVTMVVFVVSIMFVLYYTQLNNIVSFLIGLCVTTLSEPLAKLFIVLSDNFNLILVKVVKKYFGIDLSNEILKQDEILEKDGILEKEDLEKTEIPESSDNTKK